jgi:hypothetical protein
MLVRFQPARQTHVASDCDAAHAAILSTTKRPQAVTRHHTRVCVITDNDMFGQTTKNFSPISLIIRRQRGTRHILRTRSTKLGAPSIRVANEIC